jgi:hypothetical protein
MKLNLSLWLVLLITALVALNGCLFKRSMTYGKENRALILQNDSLMSVTIELNRQLDNLKKTEPKSKSRRSVSWSK